MNDKNKTSHYVSGVFSFTKKTITEAQECYIYGLFNPAAVFRIPDGGYAMAYIKEMNYPPHTTAQHIRKILGYEMVSCCDPLLGVWKPYPPSQQ